MPFVNALVCRFKSTNRVAIWLQKRGRVQFSLTWLAGSTADGLEAPRRLSRRLDSQQPGWIPPEQSSAGKSTSRVSSNPPS